VVGVRAKRRRRAVFRYGIPALAILGVAAAITAYRLASAPDAAGLNRLNPTTTAFIERDLANGAAVRWQPIAYDGISDELKLAVVVAEDINFFSHNGFDTAEMATAAREAMEGKRLRGASTITQQLAKNLWLSPSRTYGRKLREAVMTWQLEHHLQKKRILELYLNVVQFGPGVYGAEAAAEHFFDVSAVDLTQDQSAQLAAGLSRPSWWHPGSTSDAYASQVDRIRGRMERAEWLRKHF